MTSRIRIGHITDPHNRHHVPGVVANSALRPREAFGLFSKALDLFRRERVDHIVLSGDIIDVPECVRFPDGYYTDLSPLFLPAVEKDYRDVRAALERTGIPFTTVPGNHDHYPAFFRAFPEAGGCVDTPSGFRIVSYCDREWKNNTAHRYDRERKRMVAAFGDPRSPPQIHVQHFLPWPPVAGDYPYNYADAADIAKRYAGSGKAVLSLSGHYHAGTGLVRHGGCTFSAAPAFGKPPFPVRIYNVEGDRVNEERFELKSDPLYAGKRLALIDRDGVVNTLPSYNTGPELLELVPGAGPAIVRLKEAGFVVLLITNQSCIGTGDVAAETVEMNLDYLCHLLVEEAGDLAAQPDIVCYSPEAGPDAVLPQYAGTSTAKPNTAMVDEAAALFGIDTAGAWMVGDRMSDLELARRLNARSVLVLTGNGRQTLGDPALKSYAGPQTAADLAHAVETILK